MNKQIFYAMDCDPKPIIPSFHYSYSQLTGIAEYLWLGPEDHVL
jgi:hypothetical protein